MTTPNNNAEEAVRHWLASVVVELGLCPFAAKELDNNRVRFAVTQAQTEERLLADLNAEMALMTSNPDIETTLLIHPEVLTDFADFNQFLDLVDLLIEQSGNTGIFQVASFHPDYQFADTAEGDAENYTNRSPYPTLHILREASLERAIDSHPDIENVPTANIDRMNALGRERLEALLKTCLGGDTGTEA